jgi:replicative DNA helicase
VPGVSAAAETAERMLPWDKEAEQVTVGGMILDAGVIGDVLAWVSARDFFRPAHQVIFEAVLEMYQAGEKVGPVTLAGELIRRGQIGIMGGAPYLHTLIEAVPAAAQAGWHARIVREHALRRDMILRGGRIAEIGWAGDGDAENLVARAAAEAGEIGSGLRRTGLDPLWKVLPGVLDAVTGEVPDQVARVPLPYVDLQALLGGGAAPGQLILVAARPAMGKSMTALDIARWAALPRPRRGGVREAMDVLFCTLEMSREEVMRRLLAAESRVELQKIKTASVDAADVDKLAAAAARLAGGKLWIDDTSSCTIAGIQARFMELARDGCRPSLIVIDYLQLITHPGRFGNRQEQVSDMSRKLKLLAKTLDVPVIVLSQLNRGPEQRSDKRPILSDLRESGALEQDADIVILLHRDDAYEKESPRAGEADFIVAKHRDGPTSTITVAAQLHYARFADMAPLDDDPGAPEYTSGWPGNRDAA